LLTATLPTASANNSCRCSSGTVISH
jgi:hypothetical protein